MLKNMLTMSNRVNMEGNDPLSPKEILPITCSRLEMAEALKKKRNDRNMFKYQAALFIRVSTSTYSRLEDGKPVSSLTWHYARKWINQAL